MCLDPQTQDVCICKQDKVQVVTPHANKQTKIITYSLGDCQRNSTYICDPDGCEFDNTIEWMNRKIVDAETVCNLMFCFV